MAYQFIRQEPCYDHILFVLALDRDKMKAVSYTHLTLPTTERV